MAPRAGESRRQMEPAFEENLFSGPVESLRVMSGTKETVI